MSNGTEEDPAAAAGAVVFRTMHAAVVAATEIAQRLARQREQQAALAAAGHRQRARELTARMQGEAQVARAHVAAVRTREFWARASVDDIAATYAIAHAWEPHDEGLGHAAELIREEVGTRYGLTVEELSTSARPGDELAGERHVEHDGAHEAASISADHTIVNYDTHERREADHARLEGAMPAAALEARMLTDTANAKSAAAAVLNRLAPGEAAVRDAADEQRLGNGLERGHRASMPRRFNGNIGG